MEDYDSSFLMLVKLNLQNSAQLDILYSQLFRLSLARGFGTGFSGVGPTKP